MTWSIEGICAAAGLALVLLGFLAGAAAWAANQTSKVAALSEKMTEVLVLLRDIKQDYGLRISALELHVAVLQTHVQNQFNSKYEQHRQEDGL